MAINVKEIASYSITSLPNNMREQSVCDNVNRAVVVIYIEKMTYSSNSIIEYSFAYEKKSSI